MTFSSPDILKPPSPTPGETVQPVSSAQQPSQSDFELANRIRYLFARARGERKPVVAQWQKNYRIMRNRTWAQNRATYMPDPKIPEIRGVTGSCVAWVTDSRPKLELTPAAQAGTPFYDFYDELANDMKTAINAAWVTYQWEREIETMVWDAMQYDIGWLKVGWDAGLAHGLGDVSVRRRDPWTIYPDPQATCPDDMNYIMEVRRVSLQELDRRFPGAAEKFALHGWVEQSDEQPAHPYNQAGTFPRANPGAISPATSASYGLPGQSRDRASAASASQEEIGVTLIEAWLREHVYYEANGQSKLYECWRCVCVAGPFVLMDKLATDIFPFERHPFERYTPEDLGEFFGQSIVELMTPMQLAVNDIVASTQNNIGLMGNPPFVEDTRSGLQRTRMTGKPGERLTVAPGSRADWMNVPGFNPNILPLIQWFIGEMERVSGLTAMMQGQNPGGRMAADVLDSIQESGFVRVRLMLRNLEFTLRNIGQMVCAIIGEFYTEPRMVSIVGPDTKVTKSLRGRHFYLPTDEGAIPMRFQVLVHAGSMLPTSRQAKIAEFDTLFAMNAVDRAALLEAHEVPNRTAIEKRMNELDAAGIVQGPGARQRGGRLV